ncbi:MAG: hypothetical protein ABSD08_22530, partial [Xanthobacteraceae bacterium]
LRAVRKILRRDQTEKRSRFRGPRAKSRDQFYPGDRRQGVLGLQGMFPALPHFGITGGLCSDEIADIFTIILQTRVKETGRDEFCCGTKSA